MEERNKNNILLGDLQGLSQNNGNNLKVRKQEKNT